MQINFSRLDRPRGWCLLRSAARRGRRATPQAWLKGVFYMQTYSTPARASNTRPASQQRRLAHALERVDLERRGVARVRAVPELRVLAVAEAEDAPARREQQRVLAARRALYEPRGRGGAAAGAAPPAAVRAAAAARARGARRRARAAGTRRRARRAR